MRYRGNLLERFLNDVVPGAKPSRFENVTVLQTAKDIGRKVLRARLFGKVVAPSNVHDLYCATHISSRPPRAFLSVLERRRATQNTSMATRHIPAATRIRAECESGQGGLVE